MKITLSCCLCEASFKAELASPGWTCVGEYHGEDVEGVFCPDHAPVRAWAEAQCPGCVGGWGECQLWQAFAFSGSREPALTESDFRSIENGICPRRVNGTSMVTISIDPVFEDIDLSTLAPPESGRAFVDAIKAYLKRYGRYKND